VQCTKIEVAMKFKNNSVKSASN